jgi:hypothetical protein
MWVERQQELRRRIAATKPYFILVFDLTGNSAFSDIEGCVGDPGHNYDGHLSSSAKKAKVNYFNMKSCID